MGDRRLRGRTDLVGADQHREFEVRVAILGQDVDRGSERREDDCQRQKRRVAEAAALVIRANRGGGGA